MRLNLKECFINDPQITSTQFLKRKAWRRTLLYLNIIIIIRELN